MTRKVIITGATGILGRQIVTSFQESNWTTIATGFSRASGDMRKLDINDENAIERLLDEERPQVLVHSAAERSPDKVSADPEAAKKVNVNATASLARAAAQRGILIIYISTDYVFAGKEGEAPYEADAATGPTNLYGQTKLDGENAAIDAAGKLAVALRIPVLYGAVDKNADSAINVLVDQVWKAQEKDARVSMDHWSQRYPTNTEDVARVVKDIAEKYLTTNSGSLPRVLQFSSEDRYTKYEICQIFADILGLPLENMVANEQGNDPSSATQRPFDTHLSTRALQDLGISVSTQNFKDWWKRELHAFRH